VLARATAGAAGKGQGARDRHQRITSAVCAATGDYMNKPLYELVTQYRELERIDVEDIDEQMLADTLAALEGEIQLKATNVALFARNVETFADTVDEAATQMADRAKKLRTKAAGIRAYLFSQMKGAGITKISAPQFTLSIVKNPKAVMIKPDATIPDEYMVQPETPPKHADKKKLKAALEQGVIIDGVSLEQGERLSIK
jgi:hypothetical protein